MENQPVLRNTPDIPTTNQNSYGPNEHLQPFHIGCIVISLVIVAINSTVIYLFLTRMFLQKSISNIFLFSLAISDLCFGAIALPLLIGCEFTFGNMCTANYFFTLLFGFSSVYHILLAITEKFFAICFTMKHHSMFTRSLAIKLSLCVWFLSLLIAHVPLWWQKFVPQSYEKYKQKQFIFDVFSFTTTLVFPVVASATMYTMMLRKLSRRFSTMRSLTQETSRLRNERKAALMFGVMFIVFLLCWVGWFTLWSFHTIIGSSAGEIIKIAVILRYCASILNPVLYTYLKNDFREALLSFGKSRERRNAEQSGRETALTTL